jgi:hypothetical protein
MTVRWRGWFVRVALPLGAAALAYIAARPADISGSRAWAWLGLPGLPPGAWPASPREPGLVASVLPNALWFLALLGAIDLSWRGLDVRARQAWMFVGLAFAVALECRPVNGGDGRLRLDGWDAASYVVVLAVVLGVHALRRRFAKEMETGDQCVIQPVDT